ncbi:thiamine phosphate synthase [Duganella qianjiadongensis]|uniref:Thiamine-phosphate synthase n=1 Tax=Duganella qianjiadongensis TaxID=2692176 RepID=A0ABW9VJ27_9BURK|nr:thiamine phosphate synthase [Duganella qianjiadongensis]MYM38895.1 thiamine phosphate synthase [Duganella qianjiadongensis]
MQGLYLVTPNWDHTERLLTVTEQALRAAQGRQPGIALLQYRHKHASPALRLEQATALRRLCRQYDVPFIVNDFVDLALQVQADGVHLGASDAALAAVRAQLGPAAIIGASCYGDMALALAAQANGASYVAFGGFYPSRVKQYAVTTAAAILDQARQQIHLPQVVIGGMTPALAAPLVARGAHMAAAISSIYLAAGPAADDATPDAAQLAAGEPAVRRAVAEFLQLFGSTAVV